MNGVKCIFLGDTGVGKTSFINAINNQPSENINSTTGILFSTYMYNETTLQLYDTAGQEKFRSLAQQFYRSANIVVFFTTCPESDNEDSLATIESNDKALKEFIQNAHNNIGDDFVSIYILNKIDFVDAEQLEKRKEYVINEIILKETSETADSINFCAVSCKESIGISDAINMLGSYAEDIASKLQPTQKLIIDDKPKDQSTNAKDKCNC